MVRRHPTMTDLKKTAASVEDKLLNELLTKFFKDRKFVRRFAEAPASTVFHHNIKGGLLDHTMGVAELCEAACGHYGDLDWDLLITGALLHDIGKMEAYSWSDKGLPGYFTTMEGTMYGHILLGVEEIQARMSTLSEQLHPNRAGDLIHMVLSHHGKVENGWGSVVDPKTPEAVTLHYADLMDSRVAGVVQHG